MQARLQKIADLNLREMHIDDIQSGDDEKEDETDEKDQVAWYLIDTEKPLCRVWNAFIIFVTIYNLIMTPFILVFPEVYQVCDLNAPEYENWELIKNKVGQVQI